MPRRRWRIAPRSARRRTRQTRGSRARRAGCDRVVAQPIQPRRRCGLRGVRRGSVAEPKLGETNKALGDDRQRRLAQGDRGVQPELCPRLHRREVTVIESVGRQLDLESAATTDRGSETFSSAATSLPWAASCRPSRFSHIAQPATSRGRSEASASSPPARSTLLRAPPAPRYARRWQRGTEPAPRAARAFAPRSGLRRVTGAPRPHTRPPPWPVRGGSPRAGLHEHVDCGRVTGLVTALQMVRAGNEGSAMVL